MEDDFIRTSIILRFLFIYICTFERTLKTVLQFDFHNYDFGKIFLRAIRALLGEPIFRILKLKIGVLFYVVYGRLCRGDTFSEFCF